LANSYNKFNQAFSNNKMVSTDELERYESEQRAFLSSLSSEHERVSRNIEIYDKQEIKTEIELKAMNRIKEQKANIEAIKNEAQQNYDSIQKHKKVRSENNIHPVPNKDLPPTPVKTQAPEAVPEATTPNIFDQIKNGVKLKNVPKSEQRHFDEPDLKGFKIEKNNAQAPEAAAEPEGSRTSKTYQAQPTKDDINKLVLDGIPKALAEQKVSKKGKEEVNETKSTTLEKESKEKPKLISSNTQPKSVKGHKRTQSLPLNTKGMPPKQDKERY
jgi:hypothetical protein